jgi:hypothetical protein
MMGRQWYANVCKHLWPWHWHDIRGFLPLSLNLSPANWLLPVRPDVANQVNISKLYV